VTELVHALRVRLEHRASSGRTLHRAAGPVFDWAHSSGWDYALPRHRGFWILDDRGIAIRLVIAWRSPLTR